MITKEMRTVSVLSYATTKDEYGQTRQGTASTRPVEMAVWIYTQKNVADPRYVEVDKIGLTKDKEINTKDRIQFDNLIYDVLYVIPSGRYYQVLMKQRK